MDYAPVYETVHTINDIMNLPEGKHMELIEGTAYNMAPPSPGHQQIAFAIARKIADYIDENRGECTVYPAPFGVFLSEEDNTYLEPDISVICDRSKISERGCEGAPDWVIEVVSPSSKSMDYLRKLYQYKQKGIRLYWIVDPLSGYISVYDFEHDTMTQHSFNESIPVSIYNDFEIDMTDIK
ncbi:MAG: Uma2 family endonuclease [Lachnospiraceae bacterium]|nr:Uma2 family endonuclease [Lachnospiraceae bacterium]